MSLRSSANFAVVAVFGCGLLVISGCGDGDEDEQHQNEDPAGDECTVETVAADCEEDEICDDGYCVEQPEANENNDTSGEYVGEAPEVPNCVEDAAPRCEVENYDEFEFGPASYVHELRVAGDDCCIDFTGDGEFTGDPSKADNLLPDLVDVMYSAEGANEFIAGSIEDGAFSVAIEHAGLEEGQQLEAGDRYDMNFLFGDDVPDDGEVLVDTASFEQGVHPHALLPDAEIIDGEDGLQVHAGPAMVPMSIDLGVFLEEVSGVYIEVTISKAAVLADIVGTQVDGGLALDNGRVGGVVRYTDIIEGFNEYIQGCDCLHNPDALIDLDADGGGGECVLDEQTQEMGPTNCGFDRAEEVCRDLAQYCDAIPFAALFADIDTTGDGDGDAFSAGLEFGATTVEIAGVR